MATTPDHREDALPTAILDVAYDLASRLGLRGVSPRRIAAELGVELSRIVWHFPSVEDLASALVDRELGRFTTPRGETWQARLIDMFSQVGETAHQISDVINYAIEVGGDVGPGTLRFMDTAVGILSEDGGVSPAEMNDCWGLLNLMIGDGWIWRQALVRERLEGERAKRRWPSAATLHEEGLDQLAEHADALWAPPSIEDYDFGLRAALAGIAERRQIR